MHRLLACAALSLTSSCFTFVDFEFDDSSSPGAGGAGGAGGVGAGGPGGAGGNSTTTSTGGGEPWECGGVVAGCGTPVTFNALTLLGEVTLSAEAQVVPSLERLANCEVALVLVVETTEANTVGILGCEPVDLAPGTHLVVGRISDGQCMETAYLDLELPAGNVLLARTRATSDGLLAAGFASVATAESWLAFVDESLDISRVNLAIAPPAKLELHDAWVVGSEVHLVGSVVGSIGDTSMEIGGATCAFPAALPAARTAVAIGWNQAESSCEARVIADRERAIAVTEPDGVIVTTGTDPIDGTVYFRNLWEDLAPMPGYYPYSSIKPGAGEAGDLLFLRTAPVSVFFNPELASSPSVLTGLDAVAHASPPGRALVGGFAGMTPQVRCVAPGGDDEWQYDALDPVLDLLDLDGRFLMLTRKEGASTAQLFSAP